MYIVKSNFPMAMHTVATFTRKREAQRRFRKFVAYCEKNKLPYKLFLREDKEKPIRGRLQAEIGGFYYYTELFTEK